jgi:hypothetical protein
MIEQLLRSLQSSQALLHISGTMSSVYLSIITTSQKHWSLVTLDKTTYPGSFVFKKHNEPLSFMLLEKTILEDATLTWPQMPITL